MATRLAHRLQTKEPASELLILLILILSGMVFSLMIGYLFGVAIWGKETVQNASTLVLSGNYPGSTLAFMKTLQMINHAGTFLLPALLLRWLLRQPPQWEKNQTSKTTLLWLVIIAILSFTLSPLITLFQLFNQSLDLPDWLSSVESWVHSTEERAASLTDAFLSDNSVVGLIINLFVLALLPALGEEMVFRGFIQPRFQVILKNSHWAIFVTAFLFSAIHLQFYGFLPRFVLGVIFGYFFLWTGNLWTAIWAHFLNNATAVVISFMYNRQLLGFNYDNMGSVSWETILISTPFSVMLLFILWKRRT